jgi:hypothetical protein
MQICTQKIKIAHTYAITYPYKIMNLRVKIGTIFLVKLHRYMLHTYVQLRIYMQFHVKKAHIYAIEHLYTISR